MTRTYGLNELFTLIIFLLVYLCQSLPSALFFCLMSTFIQPYTGLGHFSAPCLASHDSVGLEFMLLGRTFVPDAIPCLLAHSQITLHELGVYTYAASGV